MDKLKEKIKNNKVEFIFVIIVILLFVFLTVDFSPQAPQKEKTKVVKEKAKVQEKNDKIMIDIKGAVNNPGVYEMKENSRVIDVVNKAGGLKKNADTSMINLSKKVEDEMAITIYTTAEMKKTQSVCAPCECPEVSGACISSDSSNEKNDTKDESVTINKKISINTATLEQLQTLDGIGEAKAKAIIGYRNTNGKFKKIEEIKNVSGIGDAIFEKIKDNITV